ncbi:MAG: bifunctional hydroxymethylpyrimidine kinase/phosphomethylpyrimidine kinase [Acidimicrobiales bacterium]
MTTGDTPPVVLTIAGSDSGSGAGIQADIKTTAALGVFATTAVTAVTAQNTTEVREVHHVPVGIVTAQIRAVIDDLTVAAVKTGLLGTAAVVEEVGGLAASGHLPQLVVDPVMVASTGRPLVADRCVEAYRRCLLPHALLVTPNLWEAALLADVPASGVGDLDAMVEAARRIHRLGPSWVLVKGGHLPGVEPGSTGAAPPTVADVLFDGREITVLDGALVVTRNNHGTGCSLSAAVAAHLARGADVRTAVTAAKAFVHDALLGGATWNLGQGHGPLDHLGWSSGLPAGSTGRG